MRIQQFVEFIFISKCTNLHLSSNFKLYNTMRIEVLNQIMSSYSAPTIDIIEVAAEKGFAASSDENSYFPSGNAEDMDD